MPNRVIADAALGLILAAAGCGPAPAPLPPPAPAAEPGPAAASPAPAPASTGDAPEISRSVGAEGGVVVLWPRIVRSRADTEPGTDAETRAIGASLQKHAQELVAKTLPGRPIDVRPEPERVCPRAGCKATTIGMVLSRVKSACAVVALVTPPGPTAGRLVPWGGRIKVHQQSVAFREPPEKQIGVEDYVPCAELLAGLAAKDADVPPAIKGAPGAKSKPRRRV